MSSSTPTQNLNPSTSHFQKLKKVFFAKESLYPVGLSTIVTGFLYALEHLMEKVSPCPCDPKLNRRYTCFSFLVPASVMLLLSLLVLSDAQKMITCRVSFSSAAAWRWKRHKNSCSPDCHNTLRKVHFYLFTTLKVFVPSILWAAILFQDGDYYACAYLNEIVHSQDCNVSCASKSLPHERRKLCILSQEIGGSLLVLTLLVLVVLHFLPGCLCSEEKQEGKAEDREMKTYNFQQEEPQITDRTGAE